jgi:uncharacterized protein
MKQQLLRISVADIHGNISQYEKIKDIVVKNQIAFVFLCGDLLPKTGGTWTPDNKVRTIQMQADFINDYFLDYLTELGKLTSVYAIFGNDDFSSNYHLVKELKIPNVTFLNNEVAKLPMASQDLYVAGYSYVGVTPFLHKDWEKWDTKAYDLPHKLYRTNGYSSANGKHYAVDLATESSSIQDDLAQLTTLSDPRKTIYVFHEAPYDTPLDMIAPDNKYIKDNQLHIGSVAIREFVEKKHPLMTMHGHIHETFDESGDFMWRTGNSLSVTAANDFSSDTLSYILFSLPNLSQVARLSA